MAYVPKVPDAEAGRNAATQFFESGNLRPVLAYLEQTFLPILSNRDRGADPKRPELHASSRRREGYSPELAQPEARQCVRLCMHQELGGSGVNETVIKTLLLAILFDDYRYYAFSEPEVGRGYADLCLIVRPELRAPHRFDMLFEFKLVRKKNLSVSAETLSTMTEDALKALPSVKTAFDDARVQIKRYIATLNARFGDVLHLKAFILVAVDLERIVAETVIDEEA